MPRFSLKHDYSADGRTLEVVYEACITEDILELFTVIEIADLLSKNLRTRVIDSLHLHKDGAKKASK